MILDPLNFDLFCVCKRNQMKLTTFDMVSASDCLIRSAVPEASVCDDDETSTPQMSAEPRDACSSPHRMRSAVVLPAPAQRVSATQQEK